MVILYSCFKSKIMTIASILNQLHMEYEKNKTREIF